VIKNHEAIKISMVSWMMENSNLQSTSETLVEIENPIGVLKGSELS